MNREAWLIKAVEALEPVFKSHGYALPAVKVSVGLPFSRSGVKGLNTIGQHWSPEASDDKLGSIFISPVINDTAKVLGVLLHELVHAAVGNKFGHGAVFKRCAVLVGLEGPMRSTKASNVTVSDVFGPIQDALGPYPHSKLNPAFRPVKKQKTRMIKQSCERCEYIVRSSQACINQYGPVICPGCESQMEVN